MAADLAYNIQPTKGGYDPTKRLTTDQIRTMAAPSTSTPYSAAPYGGSTGGGIINSAATTTNVPTSTNGTVSTSQGYTAAQLGDPTKWNVDTNQTVQGQIQGIIAQNSPLMQQAETRSLQQANARGLLNSAMAVSAGQSALYDAAMPIAQSDAATYAKSASYNADMSNTFSRENVAAQNKASEFSAGEANKTAAQNSVNQTNKYVSDNTLTGTKYTADQNLAGTKYASDADLAGRRYTADQNLAGTKYSSDNQLAGTKYSSDNQLAASRYTADQNLAGSKYNADKSLEQTVWTTDAQRKQALTSNVTTINQEYMARLSSIDQSNLSPEAKEIAKQNAAETRNQAVRAMGSIYGLDLSSFAPMPAETTYPPQLSPTAGTGANLTTTTPVSTASQLPWMTAER